MKFDPLPNRGANQAQPAPRRKPLLICLLLAAINLPLSAANPAWLSGLTEAVQDAVLSSPVSGIVRKRPLPEGAVVKAGDILLELDSRLEEIEVARKRLIRDHAAAELERARGLAAKSTFAISKEEIEKKQAEFELAGADLDLSLEQLRRRQIVAPFSGAIAEYSIKAGEGCQALQPLVRLVDPSRCHLVVSLDAKMGQDLKPGQSADLEIDAGRQAISVQGTLDFVSPVADPASGLMKIKVLFPNADGRLRPGVAGRMKFPTHGVAQ